MWLSLVWSEAERVSELLFFFFPFCSATVLNASPSAHDPVCSSAPQTACQASGCFAFISGGAAFRSITPQQVDKSSGQEHRWKKKKITHLSRKPGGVAVPGVIHGGNFLVAYFRLWDLLRGGELNAVCAVMRFLFFSSSSSTTTVKHRVEIVMETDRMWMYSWSTVKSPNAKGENAD